jgi:hypothetical protein
MSDSSDQWRSTLKTSLPVMGLYWRDVPTKTDGKTKIADCKDRRKKKISVGGREGLV